MNKADWNEIGRSAFRLDSLDCMNVRRQVVHIECLIERKLPSRLLKAPRFDLAAG
jgi:hypothetical protein